MAICVPEWPLMARYPAADAWCKRHVGNSSKRSEHVVAESVKVVDMYVTGTAHSRAGCYFLRQRCTERRASKEEGVQETSEGRSMKEYLAAGSYSEGGFAQSWTG